ncbi:ATP-binding protein [Streptomyces sp. AD2-2]|nr:ATP-binding protein [Streptomyces sp. AD2-2]
MPDGIETLAHWDTDEPEPELRVWEQIPDAEKVAALAAPDPVFDREPEPKEPSPLLADLRALRQRVREATYDFDEKSQRDLLEKASKLWGADTARDVYAAHRTAKLTAPDESDDAAMTAVLAGDDGSVPTFGAVAGTDRGVFYEGCVNAIYGPQSSGKSVILSDLHRRALEAGGVVIHWEFDNHTKRDHYRRLINARADKDAILARFKLITSPDDLDRLDAETRNKITLVTLDALDPAIVAFGMDPDKPSGVDTVILKCFHEHVQRGATGVLLDHVGHENTHRQAGSKRKINAPQGAVYQIETASHLSPGHDGYAELILRKDNKGGAGIIGRTAVAVRMISKVGEGEKPGAVTVDFEQYDPSGLRIERQPEENEEQRLARLLREYGATTAITWRGAERLLKDNKVTFNRNKLTGALKIVKECSVDLP